MSTPRDFSSAIRALMEVLDEGPPGMIIGGVAVIALGFPRTTVGRGLDHIQLSFQSSEKAQNDFIAGCEAFEHKLRISMPE